MTALPPLTAERALTAWTAAPLPLVLAVALLAGYAALVVRARRHGVRWSPLRTALFVVLGPGALVLATCSVLAVYRTALFWPAAAANTALAVLVPIGLALGDPAGLVRSALGGAPGGTRGGGPAWWTATAALGRRALGAPLLAAAAGLAVQFALYFTPWYAATLRSGAARDATSLLLVAVGALFAVPLLDEVGSGEPAGSGRWAGRALLAFVDGLVDAVPGMLLAISGVVVAGGWYLAQPRVSGLDAAQDQVLGGTLMVTVAEVVGAPLLVAICIRWSRADAAQAAELDQRLDAVPRAEPGSSPGRVGEPVDGRERPWWETDEGAVGRRMRRRGPA